MQSARIHKTRHNRPHEGNVRSRCRDHPTYAVQQRMKSINDDDTEAAGSELRSSECAAVSVRLRSRATVVSVLHGRARGCVGCECEPLLTPV